MKSDALQNLVAAWANVEPGHPGPYLLSGDERLTEFSPWQNCRSISQYEEQLEDTRRHPGTLQLGLIPCPYTGSLTQASVYLLMLNPGFSPLDIFAEEQSGYYRERWWKSLHQDLRGHDFPNPCFDPHLVWSGGAAYWQRKFEPIIDQLHQRGMPLPEVLSLLSRKVTFIQLVPYHSRRFALHDRVLRDLCSVHLIRDFVHSSLAPRAEAGQACVIVARQAPHWGLAPSDNIIVFSGAQARAAHLSHDETKKVILRHLL